MSHRLLTAALLTAALLAGCTAAARDAERQMRSPACTAARAYQADARQQLAGPGSITDDALRVTAADTRVLEECVPHAQP